MFFIFFDIIELSSFSSPVTLISLTLRNFRSWILILLIEPTKKSKKNILEFFYFFVDASFKIHSINFIKVIPLYLAISGTRDSLVIPGWVLISSK